MRQVRLIEAEAYPGGGVKTPTSLKNFFNLLGFLEKKIANPLKTFSVHTKKFESPPPLEKFVATPLIEGNSFVNIIMRMKGQMSAVGKI